ncbi:MAG: hypothetical protein ABI867_37455 [Kofleriaceae bacterium]
MRILAGLLVVAAACSGPKAKTESPIVNEGSAATSESCCCKSHPLTTEDGKPFYESSNRMECSQKPGECVPDVQCQKQPDPPAAP